LLERYETVKAECAEHSEEYSQFLLALEEAKPGALQEFQRAFEELGGEQFRPNSAKVKCMLDSESSAIINSHYQIPVRLT
jgi:hypothetical protein